MLTALSIQQLNKVYKSNIIALDNIDLSVNEGEFFGLLGPNGAGKSTTIGILSSLVQKTSGKVKIFDIDIDEDFSTAKQFIGIVPQEFNLNIFQNPLTTLVDQAGFYGVPRHIAIPRAHEYLERLGLTRYLNQEVGSLSGGMKRRLLIARALIHQPKLLILDEPTAGVDIELRRNLWEILQNLNAKGTTIILTTHYLEEAESLCKRLAIINHGKIIAQGPTRTLLAELNIATYVLELTQPLARLPLSNEILIRKIDDFTLEADVNNTQSLNQLFAWLAAHTIEVKSLRNKTNRLEELFIHLTKKQD